MRILRYTVPALALLLPSLGQAGTPAVVDVYKDPQCGCCEMWVDYMQRNGYTVRTHNVNDVSAVRRKFGMPERLGACHTAKVGNYLIEGHVPAADVARLLKEKPVALGIAVPGMPPGSPGMPSLKRAAFDTLLVSRDGNTRVFSRH